MTGAEAAERLGVSESTISRIRSGERRPSLDLMIGIAALFSWSMDEQATAIVDEVYEAEFTKRMDTTGGHLDTRS